MKEKDIESLRTQHGDINIMWHLPRNIDEWPYTVRLGDIAQNRYKNAKVKNNAPSESCYASVMQLANPFEVLLRALSVS